MVFKRSHRQPALALAVLAGVACYVFLQAAFAFCGLDKLQGRHAIARRNLRPRVAASGKEQVKSELVDLIEMPSPHRVQWADKGTDAFMQRLRGLAWEALTWAHLSDWQRLEWSASLLLDVVPMKELPPWFLERHNVTRQRARDTSQMYGHG
ncbi:unnamed protein product [Polarella glacialis]|uniref:Uncharacterized protein n=1 Tax=Polarella glacialis TaxID=89957 RepID=A0A813D7M4_POLGL|nr:unnamed protein product [Polarella glacialis]